MTQKEFAIAMRLVGMAQEGKPLALDRIHETYSTNYILMTHNPSASQV